jgi:uncharacterized protein YbaR (Trm112 family)
MLDDELLSLIACPVCIGDLRYEPEKSRLVCEACRLIYPIRDDIPVLLKEEALPLDVLGERGTGKVS